MLYRNLSISLVHVGNRLFNNHIVTMSETTFCPPVKGYVFYVSVSLARIQFWNAVPLRSNVKTKMFVSSLTALSTSHALYSGVKSCLVKGGGVTKEVFF